MFAEYMCPICCFVAFNIAFVISDVNTLHGFGSLKAALQYDRQLLESEVAKRPHLIMFYAPWYESLTIGSLAHHEARVCGILMSPQVLRWG